MTRANLNLILLAGIVLLPVVAIVCWQRANRGQPGPDLSAPALGDSRAELRELVTKREQEVARAVESYKPNTKAKLHDLSVRAADILTGLPGVVEVESILKPERPEQRIVHIRDWHTVPRDLYALDLATAAGRPLSADEVARRHDELLLEVEGVQAEQIAVLRCLIRHHGLRKVYSEGLTPAGLNNYREQIRVLKEMEAEQIPALKKQLADVRELLSSMKAKESTRYKESAAIEAQIIGMLNDHKVRLLELGAAGRLLIAGELEDVLPLDDETALDASRPVTPDGRVKLDMEKVRAREEAQARLLLAGDPVAVIVLGGDHDLNQPLRSLSAGRAEYLRVTPSMFRRFSSP